MSTNRTFSLSQKANDSVSRVVYVPLKSWSRERKVHRVKCKVKSLLEQVSRSADLSAIKLNSMVLALTSRCDFNLIALDNTLHTNVEILDYPLSMLQVYVSMV